MFQFEDALLSLFESFRSNFSEIDPTSQVYVSVGRSFEDIASETIYGDVSMLAIGFSVVYAYVIVMLGKFNCIEARVRAAAAESLDHLF